MLPIPEMVQSSIAWLFHKKRKGDVAMSVTIDAVQMFGGYGFVKEYPVEKMLHRRSFGATGLAVAWRSPNNYFQKKAILPSRSK